MRSLTARGDVDRRAGRFTRRLELAVSRLRRGRYDFGRADRKAEHVDELRRVLGVLLDILADWEQLAERGG